MEKVVFTTVDHYISHTPKKTQALLKSLRQLVRDAAPEAEEIIGYNMPYYKLHGPLLYFAGYKNHVGFYPMASAIEAFQHELSGYKWARGSIQFPLDQPLPVDLIKKIIAFRLQRNIDREAGKAAAKKAARKKG